MAEQSPAETTGRKYHHGALKPALIDAAERVLMRDGFAGLTLRSISRMAQVSHTAARHYFLDKVGVLSELAAVGHIRLAETLAAYAEGVPSGPERRKQIGRGYIAFASKNPDLFRLMSRNELLDYSSSALQLGLQLSSRALAGEENVKAEVKNNTFMKLTPEQAVRLAASWSLVHGLANLIIDGRLKRLVAGIEEPTTELELVERVMQTVTLDGEP